MLFPNTFSADIRKNGRKFTWINIDALPDVVGVYILFYKCHFVYVGKSVGVKGRLINHYENTVRPDGSSNENLRDLLGALDGAIKFTYISCRPDELDDLERSLICYLQPTTNEVMYSSYRPRSTEWKKSYG